MSGRTSLPRSELFTERGLENRARSVFARQSARRTPRPIRFPAVAALVLVGLLGPPRPATAADPRVVTDAPPPLSKPPRLLRFVEAARPQSLAADARADVVLTIDVDEQGNVSAVAVAASAGPEIDQAAVAAARQFRFEPGEAAGRPVPVRITYVYHFLPAPPPPRPAPVEAPAAAPVASLTGTVRRKGDRIPIAGVAVSAGGAARAITGEDGRFAFEALPPGAVALQLRSATTQPADTMVTLTAGRRLEVTIYVDQIERYASVVRGRRALVETVEQTLQAEEIKKIPGTQGDTLKAVQNLPGVARAPYGIGLLPVWGSSPADTRVFVDGVNVPTLYHFGGLRSTVNSEMIDALTFVPGGYQVDRGLGLGGVIDVQTRTPRSDGIHGYAQIDLLDGSAMLEGPLTPKLACAAAVRRSWIDATLPYFTSSTLQLSPVYWDYQARLTYRPNTANALSAFVLGSDDRLNVLASSKSMSATQAASHTYFHRGIVGWTRRLARGGTFGLTSSIGYDVPLQLGIEYGGVPTSLDAHSLGYSVRAVFDVPIRKWLRLDAGIDYEGSRYAQSRAGVARPPIGGATGASVGGFGEQTGSFSGSQSGYASEAMTIYPNHVAPFVAGEISSSGRRLTVTPQLRLQVMTFAGYPGAPESFTHVYVTADPRLSLRARVTDRVALKGAVGLYTQPPAPETLSRVFGNPDLRPQRATHYVLGGDVDLTATLRVEVAAFWKEMRDLIVPASGSEGPPLSNDGRGRAYGGELLVRQQLWRNLFGWVAYTLSRSERQDHRGEDWHRYLYDQTHILTLLASYRLPRGFQVGARFRYVTGNPFTPVVGAYYDSNADLYTPIFGAPFSERLPAFTQLDLRADKLWTFDRWRFSVYLDVQNVTRATNTEALRFSFDYRVSRPLAGLPLLPIGGVRGDF
jgi:TonB family protein